MSKFTQLWLITSSLQAQGGPEAGLEAQQRPRRRPERASGSPGSIPPTSSLRPSPQHLELLAREEDGEPPETEQAEGSAWSGTQPLREPELVGPSTEAASPHQVN